LSQLQEHRFGLAVKQICAPNHFSTLKNLTPVVFAFSIWDEDFYNLQGMQGLGKGLSHQNEAKIQVVIRGQTTKDSVLLQIKHDSFICFARTWTRTNHCWDIVLRRVKHVFPHGNYF